MRLWRIQIQLSRVLLRTGMVLSDMDNSKASKLWLVCRCNKQPLAHAGTTDQQLLLQ